MGSVQGAWALKVFWCIKSHAIKAISRMIQESDMFLVVVEMWNLHAYGAIWNLALLHVTYEATTVQFELFHQSLVSKQRVCESMSSNSWKSSGTNTTAVEDGHAHAQANCLC
eukprot:gb/GECG01001474.1/.p1 GENE.gb/GECG01001474.1/~~gb/GECG01001474.1/.p1  ORF type:complete len:112 (+),score=10.96 gb/GECG01001474.1/:1-336(+)